jgi:gliding motility-associated-like protein
MNKIFTVLLFALSLSLYAQGEANIWYFGELAGLDFNNGAPVPLTNGVLNTTEGCATISNSSGQLLFYTDGTSVYNKNHVLMVNGGGLKGDFSSSQSAIIVKKPKSSTIYYIFTATRSGYSDGIQYSEVDLGLNGGLGAVTINKNILLHTPAAEKLTAALNNTGEGIWVMCHGFEDNNFYAFSVDESGVNINPVISATGVTLGAASGRDAIGCMKVSPLADKLICANSYSLTELFDFNNVTGVVSNPRLITNKPNSYGVEFSPSGKIAYLTTGSDITSKFEVNQYDLTAVNVSSSEINLLTTFDVGSRSNSLQIAPDGKIYIATYYTPYLSAIAKPDVLGLGCTFELNAVSLNGRKSLAGLPQFTPSYLLATIKTNDNCLGSMTSFTLSSNQEIITAIWDFGDGNLSTAINPTHIYSSAGNYIVSVKATSRTGSITVTDKIIIYELPVASKPQDMAICDNNNDGFADFDLTSQNAIILNGQDPASYAVDYYANITDYNNNSAITSAIAYTNTSAYLSQTIIAAVSNKINPSCKTSTTFTIAVYERPMPEIYTSIAEYALCDDTSFGTDTDGRVLFDLTQKASVILKGQSGNQFLLTYFKDAALTQNIASPFSYVNTNDTEIIYVKMSNKDNPICFASTSFNIRVHTLPVINQNVELKQCDDDINGFSIFNLEEVIPKITTNAANEIITFFTTQFDAQSNTNPINNPTSYTNQKINTDTVYARINNSNNCFSIATVNLIISTTQIPNDFIRNFTACDDAVLGTNSDGISSFDFSSINNEIKTIFPSGQQIVITYYRNINDALQEKNSISNISNYRNIGYPNSQKIYVRVDSEINNDCLGLAAPIQLNVEPIPVLQPISEIQCDDDHDGFYAFDTTTIQSRLLNGSNNFTLTYFDQNNNSLPSPLPNPFFTESQIIKVVSSNKTINACEYETTLEFVVSDLPVVYPIPSNLLVVCDDEIDPTKQDGVYAFDTSSFQSTLLGGQAGMEIKYFDSKNNMLPSPLPNPFISPTQNIRVEVINSNNISCKAILTLSLVVHALPALILKSEEAICDNIGNFTKTINAGLVDESLKDNYSYEWFYNGNIITGESQYNLIISDSGTYTVKVTTDKGCFRTRTISVFSSNIAKIENIKIEDLTNSNSIQVFVTGIGNYVYALDNENNYFQPENLFTNVSAGIHTVFIKDLNGCGTVLQDVTLIGIPNFFTPNQDGYNDYWNIKGASTTFNTEAKINIFDRYGKLIKNLNPLDQGWDGTFNGKSLPSDDYWYTVELEDGRIVKGHFTLKR